MWCQDNYRGHPLTDVGVIVSSCQRLGLSAPPEWLEIVAPGVVDALDGSDKVANMRTDLFVKLLVGLAGLGWQPSQQQWQVCATATQQMLPLGFFRARQLLETAWAFAQFGQPVSSEFSQVRADSGAGVAQEKFI